MHRLADHVLAQHRPERGAPVAATCERGPSGTLQVEVAPGAVVGDELAEQQRPSVAEPRRVPAELVAGVGLGDGGHPRRSVVPGEQGDGGGGAQRLDVEAEFVRQRLVEDHQGRVRHRFGLPRLMQPDQLPGERIVEREQGRQQRSCNQPRNLRRTEAESDELPRGQVARNSSLGLSL